MNRRLRSVASLLSVLAFLFAQATVSTYACAGPTPDPVAMAQMKAQMEGDGGLCEKHCVTGTVSLDVAKPAPSSMPALVAVPLRVVIAAPVPRIASSRVELLAVAGPEPPLIRFSVLSI
jgi:hypothetical protein